MNNTRQRHVYHFSSNKYGGLIEIGYYNYASSTHALSSHSHPNAYEFCYLAKGQQVYEIEGQPYYLTSSDIFYTCPNEVHSSNHTPEQKGVLYWFVIKKNARWLNFTKQEQDILIKTLNNSRQRLFKAFSPLQKLLDITINSIARAASEPFSEIKTKNALSQVLLIIFESIKNDYSTHQLSSEIAHSTRLIENNIMQTTLSIKQLAQQAELSVSRYKSKFKQETGYPPADYILRAKIKKAKALLAHSSCSITEIALELGFASSQYFATVFKRYLALTPSKYRLSQAKPKPQNR